jgi:hypothetical protein
MWCSYVILWHRTDPIQPDNSRKLWWCECAAFHFNWDWFTKNMTMAASALSSIINQPHIKLHSPSCFTTLRFFKHINKPLSSTSSPRPLHHITASRTFSISNKSSEQPSLRHFVARASLTASQLQPQWVLIAISLLLSNYLSQFTSISMNLNERENFYFWVGFSLSSAA